MEMAKVTSKGQITIPISIRRRLGINEGDKILFVNKQEGVLMLNPETVQGDIADYTTDAVPFEAATPHVPAAAAPAKAPAPQPKETAPAAVQAPAAAEIPAAPAATTAAHSLATASAEADQPQKHKYIPPVEEEEPAVKPAAQTPGGLDLSTLLDDIRSIGSI